MAETSAEIDGICFQPAGVGLYDCHIEGLSSSSIHKLMSYSLTNTLHLAMHLASAKFFSATFWVVPEKKKEADPPVVTVVQKPLALFFVQILFCPLKGI